MKEKVIIFLFLWMLMDNLLLVFSRDWRRMTINMLEAHDREMKNYWNDVFGSIKKLFKGLFK